jgi:hypothetical protein
MEVLLPLGLLLQVFALLLRGTEWHVLQKLLGLV